MTKFSSVTQLHLKRLDFLHQPLQQQHSHASVQNEREVHLVYNCEVRLSTSWYTLEVSNTKMMKPVILVAGRRVS